MSVIFTNDERPIVVGDVIQVVSDLGDLEIKAVETIDGTNLNFTDGSISTDLTSVFSSPEMANTLASSRASSRIQLSPPE